MMKEGVMGGGMKRGIFGDGNGPNEVLDFGKHVGETFKQVHLEDPSYCSWTVNQDKPGAAKLRQFKYVLRRMSDLSQKNEGFAGRRVKW